MAKFVEVIWMRLDSESLVEAFYTEQSYAQNVLWLQSLPWSSEVCWNYCLNLLGKFVHKDCDSNINRRNNACR
jgi:hypothetical protein